MKAIADSDYRGGAAPLHPLREAWRRRWCGLRIPKCVTAFLRSRPERTMRGHLVLEARNLSFSFGEMPVLVNVNLRLDPGGLVGVIGPNGAGKSTLLRLLSRALLPNRGEIVLNRRALSAWNPLELARVLAVVPQNPELPPAFTSWEIVLMGRTPFLGWMGKESERDRTIARQAMMATGISHLANRRINQLSGGEQQRVVIARALAQEPRVLLLDEPTTHLDINHRVEILRLITDVVKDRRLASLAVFHDLNLASRYCDELVLLRGGTVLARGAPEQVLTPSTIQRAYDVDVTIMRHPGNNLPVVLPT